MKSQSVSAPPLTRAPRLAAAPSRETLALSCGKTRERGPAPSRLALEAAAFNAAHPVGAHGFVLRDNGEVVAVTVEAPAVVLGHVAVARFTGLRGFFSIDRFTRKEEGE